ncbi:histone chaperone [Syncephalastrum racemosum]|uniref:Anti-silencing function protein 1 n=1 Tax=Syncephalastrum racemosum TaxID=13706 RepID=A0A1X2HML5_SYNRA|nr:histone chaperone [Syncephalastrum racemosum]
MSLVNILNISVLDNPAPFSQPLQFEITFECNAELKNDLEWRMIYVGAAESKDYDQVLDSIMVGPVPVGVNKFVFAADAPKIELLPQHDLLDCTVILLSCLYNNQEFVRVGYYVHNEYVDEELRENPPATPRVDRLQRNILSEKPKVTRYTINWSDNPNPAVSDAQPPSEQQDMMVQ